MASELRLPASSLALDPQHANAQRAADLRAASQGFEALFLQQVLKSARAASLGEGLGESSALETTRSLLDMRLAEAGSARGGLGIAEAVFQQFSRGLTEGKQD